MRQRNFFQPGRFRQIERLLYLAKLEKSAFTAEQQSLVGQDGDERAAAAKTAGNSPHLCDAFERLTSTNSNPRSHHRLIRIYLLERQNETLFGFSAPLSALAAQGCESLLHLLGTSLYFHAGTLSTAERQGPLTPEAQNGDLALHLSQKFRSCLQRLSVKSSGLVNDAGSQHAISEIACVEQMPDA